MKDREDLLNKLLELIERHGALTCTGSCFRVRPDELHCKQVAIELGISVGRIWNLVEEGIKRGIIVREANKDEGIIKYKVVHRK